MNDHNEYMDLARGMGVFKDIELDILLETLREREERPGKPYSLIEVRDGKILAGFAILGRASNTDFTFDVRIFCVDPGYRSTGVADRLAAMLEEEALSIESACILRIETSSRKAQANGVKVFDSAGFSLIGHIADFYGKDDDFYMYAKHLKRVSASEAPAPPAAHEQPAAPAQPAESAGGRT